MNSNINTESYWQHSVDMCNQEDIERFNSFDEYMENPRYNTEDELEDIDSVEIEEKICEEIFEKRLKACKLRYAGMEEYMEIPDMYIWMKLKEEILENSYYYAKIYPLHDVDVVEEDFDDNYSMDSEDRKELRFLRFQDKYC